MAHVSSKAPQQGHHIDIAHLTYLPPFASGSFNRMVGAQMREMTEFEQVAISCGEGGPVNGRNGYENLLFVNRRSLSSRERICLGLPGGVRRHFFNDIGSRAHLSYCFGIRRILRRLRPKLVVCYDGYKMGPLLREVMDWPSRLILSQRGLSYYLPSDRAARVYSLRSFDAVWALSHTSYRLDRERSTCYEPCVAVLPNGVDINHYRIASNEEKRACREEWKLPQDHLVVLLLSRLVPKKGAHLLLQALPRILRLAPNAFLWLVGNGDKGYEAYLKNLTKALGVTDAVRLQGEVLPEHTRSCYWSSDVYVLPTLASEGMSLSLLEAMSCGVPCIASEHASARELYSDREVILVPDPNLEDAFVEPALRLLGNAVLRRELGQAARTAATERYSQDKAFAKIREFYHRQLMLVGAQ